MISADIDAIKFLRREKTKLQYPKGIVMESNSPKIIIYGNKNELVKKKEKLTRRNGRIVLIGNDNDMNVFHARELCPNVELQDVLAEVLLKKGMK